ncbi:MAG: bifunctional 5,10-methylenetetrahydrofolate dehydrogenase/5,10-methenyltetrahydrofolate cyclohydrolase [Bacilli bacterium]
MEKILYGDIIKEEKSEILRKEIDKINKKLKLVVIRVEGNDASKVYVNTKRKACETLGILFEEIVYNNNVHQEEIIDKIKHLNSDNSVTSVLVQLPLPNQLDTYSIINTIDYKKDVDGLTYTNIGLQYFNKGITPCTAKGIISMLNYYDIDLESKKVLIINRSNLVGKPLIPLLLNKNATITVAHSKTTNLKELTLSSDIIITAVGKPNFITKDMVTPSSIIIDVAMNRVNDKLTGDASFDELKDYITSISPVPKGVGPMTVISIIENIIDCYKLQNNLALTIDKC